MTATGGRMLNHARFLTLLSLPILLIGCKPTPVNLLDGDAQRAKDVVATSLPHREEVAKCLPADVHLDTSASSAWSPRGKITVEQELAKLGAYASADGKLHDKSGREIA